MTIEEIFISSPITDRYIQKRQPFKTQEEFVQFIIKTVLEYTGFKSIKQIAVKKRDAEMVYARYLCFYFLYKNAQLSLQNVGKRFGGRDHTTVVHGLAKLNKLFEVEGTVQNDINNLTDIMSMSVDINYLVPQPKKLTVEFKPRQKPTKKEKKERVVVDFKPKPFERPKAIYSNRTPFAITG